MSEKKYSYIEAVWAYREVEEEELVKNMYVSEIFSSRRRGESTRRQRDRVKEHMCENEDPSRRERAHVNFRILVVEKDHLEDGRIV